MIKLISIVIIFFGILIILGGMTNSTPSSNGLDFGFLVGIMLVVVGALIYMYDPVEDMKNRVLKHVNQSVPSPAPIEKEATKKVDEIKRDVQKTAGETGAEARKKINQLAKEVQKMTE